MPTVLLHLNNEDPVLGEMDEMPAPGDSIIILKNPRRKDGKDLPYVDPSVTTVVWPVSRLTFLEILPAVTDEEIISFIRE